MRMGNTMWSYSYIIIHQRIIPLFIFINIIFFSWPNNFKWISPRCDVKGL